MGEAIHTWLDSPEVEGQNMPLGDKPHRMRWRGTDAVRFVDAVSHPLPEWPQVFSMPAAHPTECKSVNSSSLVCSIA